MGSISGYSCVTHSYRIADSNATVSCFYRNKHHLSVIYNLMSKNNDKNNVDSSLSLTLIKVNSSKKRSGKVGHSDFYVYCIHLYLQLRDTFLVKRYAPRLERHFISFAR